MGERIRYGLLFLLFVCGFIEARSQCVGLPPVASLGSNKFPVGLCSPVNANVTYSVTFTSPVYEGKLELVYDWGDGSAPEIISLQAGQSTYNTARNHQFPSDSDCEYEVTITMKLNGVPCTTTRQTQKISSWRTDAFNGGAIGLVSPITQTTSHLVCEGTDIDVVLNDLSEFNCNATYVQRPPNAIESPNIENRWQQIVYNTQSGRKIPNVKVNGVALTGDGGVDIHTHYQDPRGIHYMASPVILNDPRRRPSLRITAEGGFEPAHPKAGDVFYVTLRYWNFCNPYDDPAIPGPPKDRINGDHPPVESLTVIKIQAAPAAPTATNQAVCSGTTPLAFSVSGSPSGSTIKWYAHNEQTGKAGALLSSGATNTFPITSHPQWKNNTTPGTYKLWASYEPKIAGASSCESPKILITRTINEPLTVGNPVTAVPSAICNNSSLTITLPEASTETNGGTTAYSWAGSNGVTVTSTTTHSATVNVAIVNFGTALYVDRTVTVTRKYKQSPDCGKSKAFTIRVYKNVAGGSLSSSADVCETAEITPITLSGYTGTIVRWEVKKDENDFTPHPTTTETFSPGHLSPGKYTFRALIANGPCQEAYSKEEDVVVFPKPTVAVFAGNDQFICTSLSSVALGASDPSPGTGTWTYISSVPSKLPAPTFSTNTHDPNTLISIKAEHAGAYTLRWTVTNGTCLLYDDVVIDFGTDPTVPNAGADQKRCADTTTLEGNIPEKGLGLWSIVSGPGNCQGNDCPLRIEKPSSPHSQVTLNDHSAYGTYTLRWTISSGGNNCFIKHDDVSITFDKPATLTATDITDVCLDANNLSPIPLQGIVEGASTAVWSLSAGFGKVSTSTEIRDNNKTVVEAFYRPSYEDYTSGKTIEVKLKATHASSNVCQDISQVVKIVTDRKPVAHAGSDIMNICSDTVKLQAQTPLYGARGYWRTSEAGVTFDNPASPHTVVRNLPAAPSKTSVEWVVISANGQCVSEPSYITLQRVPPPAAKNVTAMSCADTQLPNSTTTLSLQDYENQITNLPPSERIVSWYNLTGSLLTPVVNSNTAQRHIADHQQYVARVRDVKTNCYSDAVLTVAVRALPRTTDTLVQVCEDIPGTREAQNVDLNNQQYISAVSKASDVSITWYYSSADAASASSPITSLVAVKNRKRFYARITSQEEGQHCWAIAQLELLVNARPAQTAISGREAICLSQDKQSQMPVEIYQVTPTSGATYHWDIPHGNNGFTVFSGGKETDFFVMLQFHKAHTDTIGLRVELNGCSSDLLEKVIRASDAAPVPVIKGPDVVCENDYAVIFEVESAATSAYVWDIRRARDQSTGGASLHVGNPASQVKIDFQNEDILVTVHETNAGCSSIGSSTKLVRVNHRPRFTTTIDPSITAISGFGTIRTTVSSGTPPYTYSLLPGNTTNNNGVFSNLKNGNYQVQVTSSNGCSAVSEAIIIENARAIEDHTPLKLAFNATPKVSCLPADIRVVNTSTGANVYLWRLYEKDKIVSSSNDENPTFRIIKPGIYSLKLEAGSSYSNARDSLTLYGIEVLDAPVASFKVRNPAYSGSVLPIANYSERTTLYTWDFGDGNIAYEAQPQHVYKQPGEYRIVLTTSNNYGERDVWGDGSSHPVVCTDTLSQQVVIKEADIIHIPNAFTPDASGPSRGMDNGGGFNDIFLPVVKNVIDFHMLIYDRWGTLLYESKDQRIGWDGYNKEGRLMPTGVYVYKLIVKHENGEQTIKLGDVTLIK